MRLLVQAGANVNMFNEKGNTALTAACLKGHKEIVEILLDAGAIIDWTNQENDTPLTLAVLQGHVEIVKLLIARGANVNIRTKYGNTALSLAILKGHKEIVELLKAATAQAPVHNANFESMHPQDIQQTPQLAHTDIPRPISPPTTKPPLPPSYLQTNTQNLQQANKAAASTSLINQPDNPFQPVQPLLPTPPLLAPPPIPTQTSQQTPQIAHTDIPRPISPPTTKPPLPPSYLQTNTQSLQQANKAAASTSPINQLGNPFKPVQRLLAAPPLLPPPPIPTEPAQTVQPAVQLIENGKIERAFTKAFEFKPRTPGSLSKQRDQEQQSIAAAPTTRLTPPLLPPPPIPTQPAQTVQTNQAQLLARAAIKGFELKPRI